MLAVGFVGECQQSTVNPGELHFTAQWMPSVQSREWAYWARSWAKIKLYQDTGYYVLGIDVHREIPCEKISRFCMMMNNIPNCNGMQCWSNILGRFLVTTTFSRKYILTKIFACTPILRETIKSVRKGRLKKIGPYKIWEISQAAFNWVKHDVCVVVSKSQEPNFRHPPSKRKNVVFDTLKIPPL